MHLLANEDSDHGFSSNLTNSSPVYIELQVQHGMAELPDWANTNSVNEFQLDDEKFFKYVWYNIDFY